MIGQRAGTRALRHILPLVLCGSTPRRKVNPAVQPLADSTPFYPTWGRM
jgi:hypothetical protein